MRLTAPLKFEGPVRRERLDEALAAIAAEFGRLSGGDLPDALVGMG